MKKKTLINTVGYVVLTTIASMSLMSCGGKKAATITVEPTAKTLTYTGNAQELVSKGVAEGGSIQYKVGTGSYSLDIPTATEVGSYTVYYQLIDDDKHEQGEEKFLTAVINKAKVDVPTANLTYNGNEQTGIASDPRYTLSGTTKATDAGNYLATASLLDKNNCEWNVTTPTSEDQSIHWSIAKASLEKDDLTFIAPTNLVYDGTQKIASFTNSKTHFGAITARYSRNITADEWTTEAPKNAGTYYVKACIPEDNNHNVVDLTDSAWSFTITSSN